MNINFMGRRGQAEDEQADYDVYEADAERLYDSFSDLYEDFDEGRSKTPFVIIGALLAVAIVGGGLAFAYKRGATDGGDGPAVVLAERTPNKVELEDPGGVEIPHQDRQVFEEVAGEGGSSSLSGPVRDPLADAGSDGLGSGGPVVDSQVASGQVGSDDFSRAGFGPTAGGDQDAGVGGGDLTIGALAQRVTRELPGPLVPAGAQTPERLDVPDVVAALPETPPLPELPSAQLPSAQLPSAQLPSPLRPESLVPSGSQAAAPSAVPASTGVFEPRRVPTVTIGPDGSVISTGTQAPTPTETLAPARSRALSATPTETLLAPATREREVAALAPEPAAGTLQPSLLSGTERLNPDSQTSLFAPSPRPKPRPTTRVASVEPSATPPRADPGSRAPAGWRFCGPGRLASPAGRGCRRLRRFAAALPEPDFRLPAADPACRHSRPWRVLPTAHRPSGVQERCQPAL